MVYKVCYNLPIFIARCVTVDSSPTWLTVTLPTRRMTSSTVLTSTIIPTIQKIILMIIHIALCFKQNINHRHKRYFIIDQQIGLHLVQYNECLSTPHSLQCNSNNFLIQGSQPITIKGMYFSQSRSPYTP